MGTTKKFFNPEPRVIAQITSIISREQLLASIRAAFQEGADAVRTGIALANGIPVIVPCDYRPGGQGKENQDQYLFLVDLLHEFNTHRFNFLLVENRVDLAEKYAAVLRDTEAECRILTSSFYKKPMKRARKLLPESAVSYTLTGLIGLYALYRSGLIYFKKKFRMDAVQTYESIGPSYIASQGFIRRLKTGGIHVYVFAQNQEKMLARLWEAGVDGFITDDSAGLSNTFYRFIKSKTEGKEDRKQKG